MDSVHRSLRLSLRWEFGICSRVCNGVCRIGPTIQPPLKRWPDANSAERRLREADRQGDGRVARFAPRSKTARRPGWSATRRAKRSAALPTRTATTSSICGAISTAASKSYRDIDADFDNKADQYRWFNTGGTRWGIDKNEDGRIDFWQVISAPEVAEELVWALKIPGPDPV